MILTLEQKRNFWNSSAPTSQVFGVSDDGKVSSGIGDHIAYCFAGKQGFSKVGNYFGNGNADGTFIYTGFKPAFFMIKSRSFNHTNWMLYDNKRDPYNQMVEYLYPNTSAAAATNSAGFDFLSNGIKIRNTFGDANESGEEYFYMCFRRSTTSWLK